MKTKFNPKIYEGKKRIYKPVTGYQGISKLWSWTDHKSLYEPPTRGKCYSARRTILVNGQKKRESQFFESLDEARIWLLSKEEKKDLVEVKPFNEGHSSSQKSKVKFQDVVVKFREYKYKTLQRATVDLYERRLRLYFKSLMNEAIDDFGPQRVDQWIEELRTNFKAGHFKETRVSFKEELKLLITIIGFCREYYDEFSGLNPIKRRHREAVILAQKPHKEKHLELQDFFKFREALKNVKNGELYYDLATVQFYQALRISEACAIRFEDVKLVPDEPMQSKLTIVQSVYWPRKRGQLAMIQNGFKNSKKLGGKKVSTLLPESFSVLAKRCKNKIGSLVFSLNDKVLEYRDVQHAYDTAFKVAGLPYRGTHLMRHGGASFAYNMSNGNLALSAAVLGNTLDVARTYSHLDQKAQRDFAQKIWDQSQTLAANGCNSLEAATKSN